MGMEYKAWGWNTKHGDGIQSMGMKYKEWRWNINMGWNIKHGDEI